MAHVLKSEARPEELGGKKLSVSDLIFLETCDKSLLQGYLGNEYSHLIEVYSSVEYLNTHCLELIAVCHKPVKKDTEETSILDLPLEIQDIVYGNLTLSDLQAVASRATIAGETQDLAGDYLSLDGE